MATSPFVWGAGGQALSPDQVEQRRAMAQMALRSGSDTSPVQHWSQGLARIVDALGGYRGMQRADAAEAEGLASAQDWFNNLPGQSTVSMSSQSAPAGYSLPQGPGADSIRAGLIQRGLPEHVADAFVLNFQDESGLNPGINEISPTVAGSRGGFGLAQWTGPRRVALEQAAMRRGVDPSDTDLQLDFLVDELGGSESRAGRSILGAPDTGSAAAAIVNDFLRPAEEHRRRREAAYLGIPEYDNGYRPQGANQQLISALMQGSSNPWVAQRYGGVIEALLGQEMQRGQMADQYAMQMADPMRRLQYETAVQGLVDARTPQAPKPIEVGGVLLDGSTYQPIFDSRQPDAGTALQQNLAAAGLQPGSEDYRNAILANVAPQPAQTNVTVNNGEGDKFYEQLDKGQADMFGSLLTEGQAAATKLQQVDQLSGLLETSPQGAEAAFKAALGEYGIQTEGLDKIQAANALINQIVPQQRQPGSGPMSDADLALFKQSVPRLINSPEGNRIIIEGMRGVSEYTRQQGEIAAAVANREMTPADGRRALQALQNPLSGWNERTQGVVQSSAPADDGWQTFGGVKIRVKQ